MCSIQGTSIVPSTAFTFFTSTCKFFHLEKYVKGTAIGTIRLVGKTDYVRAPNGLISQFQLIPASTGSNLFYMMCSNQKSYVGVLNAGNGVLKLVENPSKSTAAIFAISLSGGSMTIYDHKQKQQLQIFSDSSVGFGTGGSNAPAFSATAAVYTAQYLRYSKRFALKNLASGRFVSYNRSDNNDLMDDTGSTVAQLILEKKSSSAATDIVNQTDSFFLKETVLSQYFGPDAKSLSNIVGAFWESSGTGFEVSICDSINEFNYNCFSGLDNGLQLQSLKFSISLGGIFASAPGWLMSNYKFGAYDKAAFFVPAQPNGADFEITTFCEAYQNGTCHPSFASATCFESGSCPDPRFPFLCSDGLPPTVTCDGTKVTFTCSTPISGVNPANMFRDCCSATAKQFKCPELLMNDSQYAFYSPSQKVWLTSIPGQNTTDSPQATSEILFTLHQDNTTTQYPLSNSFDIVMREKSAEGWVLKSKSVALRKKSRYYFSDYQFYVPSLSGVPTDFIPFEVINAANGGILAIPQSDSVCNICPNPTAGIPFGWYNCADVSSECKIGNQCATNCNSGPAACSVDPSSLMPIFSCKGCDDSKCQPWEECDETGTNCCKRKDGWCDPSKSGQCGEGMQCNPSTYKCESSGGNNDRETQIYQYVFGGLILAMLVFIGIQMKKIYDNK